MANVLAHLSSILIPAVIFFIIGYGWIHKCNLYDDFINGAADGLKTVVGIVPTLIGLMMAVGILRGSGLLDLPGKGQLHPHGPAVGGGEDGLGPQLSLGVDGADQLSLIHI